MENVCSYRISSIFFFCTFPLFPLYWLYCNANFLFSVVLRYLFSCTLYSSLLLYCYSFVSYMDVWLEIYVLGGPYLPFFRIFYLQFCFFSLLFYEFIIINPSLFVNTFFKISFYFLKFWLVLFDFSKNLHFSTHFDCIFHAKKPLHQECFSIPFATVSFLLLAFIIRFYNWVMTKIL